MCGLYVHLKDRIEKYSTSTEPTAYEKVIKELGPTSSQKIKAAVQYQKSGSLYQHPQTIKGFLELFPQENSQQLQALAEKLQESELPVVVVNTDDQKVGEILNSHGFKPLEEIF